MANLWPCPVNIGTKGTGKKKKKKKSSSKKNILYGSTIQQVG